MDSADRGSLPNPQEPTAIRYYWLLLCRACRSSLTVLPVTRAPRKKLLIFRVTQYKHLPLSSLQIVHVTPMVELLTRDELEAIPE